ncbi:alpha-L-fucosidase-domain-containing protein [Mucor lusitanicus]|nr:alpha-L-fucosidase-domain-containing protein [Mucor lusitanicus]
MHLVFIALITLCLIQCVQTENDYISLDLFLNNKGAQGPGSDFDGAGTYFKCPMLSSSPTVQVGSIRYQLSQNSSHDNMMSRGQIITLANKPYSSLYLLASVNHGPITADITLVYQDGTKATTTLNLPDWQVRHTDQIHRLDHIPCQLNTGASAILISAPLLADPAKNVSHILFPYNNPLGSFTAALHAFAMTGITAKAENGLAVISAKGSRRWWENTQHEYPIVTVRVQNTGLDWVKDASVFVKGPLFRTQYHGHVKRLAPGHIMNVDVGIHTVRKGRVSTKVIIQLFDASGNELDAPTTLDDVAIGIEQYQQDERSLHGHSPPHWYETAKFGIFIHWGLYSVPSWAPVGADYAEWYWWNYNRKGSATYNYHRAFYGPDIEYDDFIQAWQPDQFDAQKWLDIIDSSGAKYFVFTTKHHDGFALFDTKVTDRSSVKMNPYKDFTRELLSLAKEEYPHLKRGVYFSMPEWYHPSYHDRWLNWDGPPVNPYTGKQVPYTGSPAVDDFVNEVQVPQVLELIDHYEPDIMWCDIGGINNSTAWQAYFLNKAREQGRQVTMNDRCGNSVSDFTTVEYRGISHVPSRLWESTRGIDPHSFGYNHQTRPDQYAPTESLLQELVSVVAKGGNFLLNIGPEASGHVPHVMRKTLYQIGQWIDRVDESIFDSVPYWVTSQDLHEPGQPLYFTQSRNGRSFYIFSFNPPLSRCIVVKTKVPLHPQGTISLLSSAYKEEPLKWSMTSNDRLIINVPDHIMDQEHLLWVFKIEAP